MIRTLQAGNGTLRIPLCGKLNSGGKHASGIHTLQAGSGTLRIARKHASVIRTLQAGNGTLRIPLCGKLRGETCIRDTRIARAGHSTRSRWNLAARSLSRGRSHGKTERQRKMAAEKICIAHSKAIRIGAKRDFTAAIARFGPVENPRETSRLEFRRDRRPGKAAAEEDPRRGSRRSRVQSIARKGVRSAAARSKRGRGGVGRRNLKAKTRGPALETQAPYEAP